MFPSFLFAGFQFPKAIPELVDIGYCGTPTPLLRIVNRYSKAVSDHRQAGGQPHNGPLTSAFPGFHRFKVSTSYSTAPEPLNRQNTERSFYHGSMGFPGLRWDWCDDMARIDHTGWFTDEDGCSDKIRGIVFRLPHGRGLLVGWSMGEGMAGVIDTGTIWHDERDAAHAADRLAEIAAENEREYRAEQDVEDEDGDDA